MTPNLIRIPSIEDFHGSEDFQLEINNELYGYIEGGFQLREKLFDNLDKDDIKFMYKNIEVPLDYRIDVKENEINKFTV